MNRLKQKRNRGVILTIEGLEKLQAARIDWEREHNFGERCTYEKISELTNLDISTIKKILGGKIRVDKRSLEKFFFAFNLQLSSQFYTKIVPQTRHDWREATSIDHFFGRTKELDTLRDWVNNDRCRLIVLQGMGGIGKTTLALKFAQQVLNNFDCVIWKSLKDAPPIENVLESTLDFISKGESTKEKLPQRNSQKIGCLISHLRSQRCLVVLDNAESVLDGKHRAGKYLQGYEGYGELITRIGSTDHKSCVIITTREKPQEIAVLEGDNLAVRSLLLPGSDEASSGIFKLKALEASELELNALRDRYGGNPLALKVVATTIKDLFEGNISKFLAQELAVFGDIRDLLDRQFERLSVLEREIMYWLAIAREPISLEELQKNKVRKISFIKLLEAVESLSRRSLIEKNTAKFTQQPVVMEYVTSRLIETSCQEIVNRQPKLLNNHSLLQATAKEYITNNQSRLILRSLVRELEAAFLNQEDLTNCLNQIILDLQTSIRRSGYTAGNIINLLCHMAVDLTGYDFSNLCVWQADLRQAQLHNVSFQNADLSRSVFAENFGGIWSVAFSPDGEYLAAGDTKGDIILRRMSDGLIVRHFTGHSGWVVSLDFSPDGKTLASSSCDCTVKLWDVQTSHCIHILKEHEHEVWSVAFNSDGKYLASGCDDTKTRLWDVNTGECIQVFEGHSDYVLSVTFNSDGTKLITGSHDRTIKIWNLKNKECIKTFEGHEDGIRSVSLSPNGQIIASGSSDLTIRLWDLETGKFIKAFQGHSSMVMCVAFCPQNKILASSSIDGEVRLWNYLTGECLKIFSDRSNMTNSVAFNLEGNILASGSYDQTVKLWTTDTHQCLKTWPGYSNQILSVAFSPDRKTLVSGGHDRKIRLWDLETGEVIKTLRGHSNWVFSVAYSFQQNNILASGSADTTIKLWDLNSGKIIKTFNGHSAAIRSVAFCPSGKILASAGEDRTIILWDTTTGKKIKTLDRHKGEIWSIAFSHDSKILASASFDETVILWDAFTGEYLQSLNDHESWVFYVVFSYDNKYFATTSSDRTIRIWNRDNNKCQTIIRESLGYSQLLAWSHNNQIIASCNGEYNIKLWDISTGECLMSLKGHNALINSIKFSYDDNILVSSSEDETIKLWDINNERCLKTLKIKNPYDRMNIKQIDGLTYPTIKSLEILGATI